MDKFRLRFEKTGRAVYMSHLDLMRTMQRAFSRGGLPLKYSEGFNPHALISIVLPLSVGAASHCEIMDFRVDTTGAGADFDPRGTPSALNAVLPEGIRVIEAYRAGLKAGALKWLRISGDLSYDAGISAMITQQLDSFFAADSILVTKKTKRGTGEVDIAPAIDTAQFGTADGKVRMTALVSAQEPTLNPERMMDALRQNAPHLAPDFAVFTRLETLTADFAPFR